MDTTTWRCGGPPSKGQKQQYPSRFLHNLERTYGPLKSKKILSMFSGASDLGVTTDINSGSGADHICPYEKIPLDDDTFDMVVADPPYTKGFSNEWVTLKKDVPRPKRILREAARLVKPDGLICILHVIIIPAYKDLNVERIALHPVLAGPNNAIRVLNVFRKKE